MWGKHKMYIPFHLKPGDIIKRNDQVPQTEEEHESCGYADGRPGSVFLVMDLYDGTYSDGSPGVIVKLQDITPNTVGKVSGGADASKITSQWFDWD